MLHVPGGSSNIGNSNNQNVGIGISAPTAKLDIVTNTNTGALKIRGTNATSFGLPGQPNGTVSTPFALKVEFNQTAMSPQSINTTALLDVQGRLFLGEFSSYTGTHHINTQQGGVAINGINNSKLFFTYNTNHGNYVSWKTDNTTNDKRNLAFGYNGGTPFLNLSPEGQVLIGTNVGPGTHKLYVAGTAIAEEVVVELQTNWPDYVFAPSYTMLSTADLRNYIQTNGKLPYLADAESIAQDGLQLGETQAQLTRLVEELTLRLLEMDERIVELESQLAEH